MRLRPSRKVMITASKAGDGYVGARGNELGYANYELKEAAPPAR